MSAAHNDTHLPLVFNELLALTGASHYYATFSSLTVFILLNVNVQPLR